MLKLTERLSEPDSAAPTSAMQRFIDNMWPAFIWMAGIFILTLLPGNYFPRVSGFWNLLSPDKLVHIVLFAGFSLLLAIGLKKQYPACPMRYIYLGVLVISIFMAILTEILQWFLPIKRDGNVYDAIADIAGVFIGFAIFFILKNKIAEKIKPNRNNV